VTENLWSLPSLSSYIVYSSIYGQFVTRLKK
jgi:hypothetical protein